MSRRCVRRPIILKCSCLTVPPNQQGYSKMGSLVGGDTDSGGDSKVTI